MMQKHHVITVTMFLMWSVITMIELPGVNCFSWKLLKININSTETHIFARTDELTNR